MDSLTGSARRVAEELARLGVGSQVVTTPESTRTALEAAAALDCEVDQIVKSLVFRCPDRDEAVMVLMSGGRRVDEARLAQVVGRPVEQASGRFVRERTGFAIGGVPPVGHLLPLDTYMDEGLLRYQVVWAAAGTPHAVFSISPADLQAIAQATVADLAA